MSEVSQKLFDETFEECKGEVSLWKCHKSCTVKNACVVFTLTHCDTHKNTHSHTCVIYCCVMATHYFRVTLHLPKWLKSCKRF